MTPAKLDWQEVSLGEICEFKYGRSLPAPDRLPGQYGVFGSNGQVGSHVKALTVGPTIIIGRKGSLGEITYSDYPCWPIDTTYYVDATATTADLKWLSHCLRYLGLTELNRAAAVPGLNREDAYQKRLLLPPINEQRRIANILDLINKACAKRREALALLDDLAQSIFLDMFKESSTVPIIQLGDQLRFVTSGGRGWAKYYSAYGARFIRSLDVRMNEIGDQNAVHVNPPDNAEARRTRVQAGDVLLTITGSLIGRVAPVSAQDQGSYISQHVAILRPDTDSLVSKFLAFYLSLPSGGQAQISRMQYGQTKPGLNFDQIRDFRVPLPSLGLQNAFVERLNLVRNIRVAHQTHQAGLDSLFRSVQYCVFDAGTLPR